MLYIRLFRIKVRKMTLMSANLYLHSTQSLIRLTWLSLSCPFLSRGFEKERLLLPFVYVVADLTGPNVHLSIVQYYSTNLLQPLLKYRMYLGPNTWKNFPPKYIFTLLNYRIFTGHTNIVKNILAPGSYMIKLVVQNPR